MSREKSDVLDTVTVREVFGTFASAAAVEEAVQDLLIGGFDRADIDLMAGAQAVRDKLSGSFKERRNAGDYTDFMTADESLDATALVTGALVYIGAVGAAAAVVASGGSVAAAAAAALAGGAGGGGLGSVLRRKLGAGTAEDLATRLTAGEMVLWVRVHDPERERRAADILAAHGALRVDAADIELEKRVADLPFASIRPDPWLSDEPLGTIVKD